MECNKEEAIRAKGIAEDKMLNKDFFGARKIVLKAQQLYPDLENVSQMLTVCDVHCSAEVKVNGEMDWYGILQVAPAADEITIKKQFRRLALLLHPDKNKFGGAEAAFKLVGEAQRVLTDRPKRVLYDMKRGASFRTVPARQPAPQANKSSYTKKQPEVASSFANSRYTQSNGFNPQQQTSFASNQTFWTICPSCGVRYQYYQTIMNKALRCQSCKKPFVAHDINAHTVPSAAPWNRPGIPQQEKRGPPAHFSGQRSNFGTGSNQGNVDGGSATSQPWSRSGFNKESGGVSNNESKEDVMADRDGGTANDVKFEKVKLHEMNKKEQAVKSSAGNRSQKRGRKIAVESSESESSDSDVVVEDVRPSGQNTGKSGSNPRRSSRQKQNISYNEEKSDDDDFVTPKGKRSRIGGTSLDAEQSDRKSFGGDANSINEAAVNAGTASKVNASVDFSSEASPDPDSFSYPDPEFYDFDGESVEKKFAVDQIWAIYDNLDAMPRYYALIRRVYGPKFKLRFNWLEYDPTGKAETLWYKGDLPIGSGSFKLGKAEHTQERLMFSHLMRWRRGTKKNTFDIFPLKGEIWALFKNWDIGWSSCVDNDRHYEYEIVEVVSDFTVDDVITVVRLVRIQGFVSLFAQATDQRSGPLKIQMKDMLQFSHKIPSYRLKGNEREGIPQGSLELDTASLPLNFAEMFPSVSLEDLNSVCNGLHSKSAGKEELPTCTTNKSSSELDGIPIEELQRSSCHGSGTYEEPNGTSMTKHAVGGSQNNVQSEETIYDKHVGAKDNTDARDPNTFKAATRHNNSQSPSSPNCYEYPDSEFHNFEEGRVIDKFVEGQIWAIYSDVDMNPNFYGRISKVEKKKFRVHVTWLEGYTDKEHEKGWCKRQLPIGCGTFKAMREGCVLDTTDTFSHIVQAIPTMKKNHYLIYPQVGDIWAVYKNWSLEWSLSDLRNCEIDFVEILDVTSSGFKVMMLSKVTGYRAVFMGERIGASTKTVDISFDERWKFSFKIPAFKLTEERGGKLRGYWELDPASVPDIMLFTDSN